MSGVILAYLAVNGIGLGHAGRSIEIADQLSRKRARIMFSSYGDALSYIRRHGYRCHAVEELSLPIMGELVLENQMTRLVTAFIKVFTLQVSKEIRLLSTYRPSVVLSDSRGSAVIAARFLGIPVFTLINQIITYSPPSIGHERWTRLFNYLSYQFLPKLWALSDHILIPDFPPPYTISRRNIDTVVSRLGKVTFVGPTSKAKTPDTEFREYIESFFEDTSKPLIYAGASGPRGDKIIFNDILEATLPSLRDDFNVVLSKGNPGDLKGPTLKEGYVLFDWIPKRLEMMSLSDLILARAGSMTISQAIVSRKPLVVIPPPGHTEQEENSRRVKELGIGERMNQSKVDGNTLSQTIYKILRNYSQYFNSLETLADMAGDLGGAERVSETLLQNL